MVRNLLLFALILFSFSCFKDISSNQNQIIENKITNNGVIYTLKDFLTTGFKINKEYDVTDLEDSNGVWFGFWENELKGILDYEIRIYPSHQLAVDKGIFYVEEVIGENAILKKTHSSWKEGIQDRRTRSDRSYKGSSANTIRAKYIDYIVFGNSIILCTGLDLTDARLNCSDLVNSLNK